MLLQNGVVENWTLALVQLAHETNQVSQFIDQTNLVTEVLKDQPAFIKMMDAHNEVLKKPIPKAKLLDELFGVAKIDPLLLNALKMLADNYAFSYARPIFKAVRQTLLLEQQEEYGVIWSTFPLRDEDIAIIETKVSKKLGLQVKLINKIDPKLIGGVQVVAANQVFDGSLKGQLTSMKQFTLNNKAE